MSRPATWPVVEVFGPTIQGEGALIGARTHFIRFGHCDFRCVWCDSMHAVEPSLVKASARRMDASDLVDALQRLSTPHAPWVTLSGGNPCIYDLSTLVGSLLLGGWKIAVETQGTLCPEWLNLCHCVTVAPKPPSALQGDTLPALEKFLTAFYARGRQPQLVLKCVVMPDDPDDMVFARKVYALRMNNPFFIQIGNPTPGNPSPIVLLEGMRRVTEQLLETNAMPHAYVLPQLHTLLWGNVLAR